MTDDAFWTHIRKLSTSTTHAERSEVRSEDVREGIGCVVQIAVRRWCFSFWKP
jgi:hypothetical protein